MINSFFGSSHSLLSLALLGGACLGCRPLPAPCTPSTCIPSSACMTATCTPSGCIQTPLPTGTACSDGSACTTDGCDGFGNCLSTPIVLPTVACLVTTCDPALGIVTTPASNGTTCTLDACTVGAACQGGTCTGGTPRDCRSRQVCVTDGCDSALGCTHTQKPAGADCSDANVCNGTETCSAAGTCDPGVPVSIDDSNICTVDSCDPIAGVVHTPLPNCDPTPVLTDAPFETRASLLGTLVASGGGAVTGAAFTVTNAPAEGALPNAPRGDVSASSAVDGSSRVRLTSFPEVEADRTPPLHVLVRIATSAFLPAYRDAWIHSGDAVDLGVIKLVARDPAVTNIGPAGGTASDSQDRIEVVIPAGALASTVPIRITPIVNRDDMTAPLPESTVTGYGYELEPSGTAFAVPVTVRLANWRNAPTTVAIPAAFYDTDRGRWEHVAVATWDGTRFSFQTTHFSPGDANGTRPGASGPSPVPGPPPNDPPCGGGPGPGPGGNPEGPLPVGSGCGRAGGGVSQDFALPTYRIKNEDFGIHLTYQSGLAGGRRLGASPANYGAVSHSTFAVSVRGTRFELNAVPRASGNVPVAQPGRCADPLAPPMSFGGSPPIPLTLTQSVAGATTTETFAMGPLNTEAEFGGYVDLPILSPTSASSSGLYRTHMVLRAQTPGSCVASGGTFGVNDFSAPGTQTSLEDGPLATIDTYTLVHHRLTSPFGAGWAVGDVSRVYREGDLAYLVSGAGDVERFAPRAHAKSLPSPNEGHILARDPHTGEVFTARDGGSIERVDTETGALTPVLSGLAFNASVHGLAVAFVGGAREFIVALEDRLVEIDGGGAQRVLTTRAAGALFSQASVAAREDVIFYTDSNGQGLFRVRLSDPARPLESMSLATGGDVRFYPQAPLSGMSFADPRGLAFGADGTLYVADRSRNTVYAVSPDAAGNVGSTSHVEPVAGDGQGSYISSAGERQPGVRFSLREPLGLSMTGDGLLFIVTTYGIASFDPLAREVESLVLWGGIDELTLRQGLRISILGLTATSALGRAEPASGANLMRFDIDRMSSERDPTRVLRDLAGGQLELMDTTRERVETFDGAGRLVQRRKRTGETILSVTYADARGDAIDRITDAVGGETVFTYAGGKIQSITDPRGRVTHVSVDALGDLVSFTEPGNETHSFVYAEHRMTEKRSPRSDLTQYTYRADGTMQSATRPEGAVTSVVAALSQPPVFNSAGKIERRGSYTDARGVHHDLVLNLKGGVEQDTHFEDGVTRVDTLTYATTLRDVRSITADGIGMLADLVSDRKNRFFAVTQHATNGVALGTTMQFDAHARPIQERRGGLEVHRWQYDANGWLLEELNGPSHMADRYERDAVGHVTRIFDQQAGVPSGIKTGRERRWTYRADGLLLTMTEHGVTRTYLYAELPGTLNEMGWTDTLGRSMTFTRDANGNVTSTSDGTATTHATYDVRNRVTETRDALNNTTTYGYSHAGCGCSQADLVTSIHTPDLPAGIDWRMTYDHDARLASVTDPHGFTESYAYEPTRELKKVTDRLGRDTTWSHDSLGRVLAMVDALGRNHASTYTVPASGAWTGPTLMAGGADGTAPTTSLTEALRSGDYQIGHNAYRPAGAPPAISLYRDATFALGFSHFFDEGNRLTFRRDRSDVAIDSTVIPTQSMEGAFWDEKLSYELNTSRPLPLFLQAQRSTNAVESNLFTRDFDFDVQEAQGFGSGGLSDTTLVETFTRDAGGRPTLFARRFLLMNNDGINVRFDGADVTSTYTYRPDGRLAQLVNPDGTHTFTYDARGLLLTQVVSGEGTYTYGYDVMGRPSSLTYPDGHTRTQVYDALGRITSRCYEYSGPPTRCYMAQYDAIGNPTHMVDPDGADAFEYDALDRLKKVTREVGGVAIAVEDYDYNALGALKLNAGVALDHQRPRLDGAGNADAAVPATAGGQPVTLDAGGRVTSLRGTSFTWSREGFLRQVQDPIPAVAESYAVDSEFRRVAKIQGSAGEYYVYEDLDRVATLAPNGAVLEQYLFDGIDHPLRIKQGATVAYYELDLAGNVRELRASGGASLGGYRYSAFGQTVEDTTSITQPLRWKGRWFSPVAGGTYDVRARQWSPELGVFLAIDEYEFQNIKSTLWGWPKQSPVRFRDPMGRGKPPSPVPYKFEWTCPDGCPIASKDPNNPSSPSACAGPNPPKPGDRNECCVADCFVKKGICNAAPIPEDTWRIVCACPCVTGCGCKPSNFSCP